MKPVKECQGCLGPKFGQIGPKWDKSGLKSPRFVSFRPSLTSLVLCVLMISCPASARVSNMPSKLSQIGPQMGQIWDFLRSVSVHFVSYKSGIVKIIVHFSSYKSGTF